MFSCSHHRIFPVEAAKRIYYQQAGSRDYGAVLCRAAVCVPNRFESCPQGRLGLDPSYTVGTGRRRIHQVRTGCSFFRGLSSNTQQTRATDPRTSATSMAFIDKLALILISNRKTLVARSRGKEVFFTPGGKREPGESDEEALVREVIEELAVEVVTSTIKPYGTFQAQAFGKPEGTMVRITCFTADYKGTLTPSSEIDELKWISSSERHKTTITGQMILDDLKAKDLID
ncbi:hypothetical protein CYMTET_27432 [Cymbomonas tetramitiformis]|uniref:Nudix hydrolase domain-containing protein n=1 Tax=Cymbomonas tetramitiformis TaxID=36881 RepID=A0AAE0FQG3_9CHLO|nr:hypothetical protein CYMTET_27432 [Cymbomonas tetramitiformis]